MLRRRLLVTIITSSIIVFSIIWFSKSVEVTARIVRIEILVTEAEMKSPITFYLDNGDEVEVSEEDFYEYREGDLFTYRKSLADIHTPFVYDFGFLYIIFWIGLVALIGLAVFVGLSSVATQIRNKEANSETKNESSVTDGLNYAYT